MARFASPEILLRVSKAEKKAFDWWREGVHLEKSSGRTLDELRHRATSDRLDLATQCRRRGDRLMVASPPLYRDAISRYYYSMYHAMRAVVFFVHGGDDHEEHKVLPSKTPRDFVDADLWQNALKDARATRNAADYDPYPKSREAWRASAATQQAAAATLVQLCRDYLVTKGCQYL